jgi:hypothetical protein
VESNWVNSALSPQIGLLCQPRVIMEMEKLVEWLARETELTCRPEANLGRLGGKPAANSLSYGTAHQVVMLVVIVVLIAELALIWIIIMIFKASPWAVWVSVCNVI